jgi:hypothetical protein
VQSQESTAKAPWDSLKFFVGNWLRIPADADQHSWVIPITIPT